MSNASVMETMLAMRSGPTTPPPPQDPKWFHFLSALTIAVLIVSILGLSGCSTVPATKAPWSPPQATLTKSEPLPHLADDPSKPDDARSTIGVMELVGDNFAIVKAYKRLAKRHDELVDAVMAHLNDQAK